MADAYRKERRVIAGMVRQATRDLEPKIPPGTPEHLRKALVAQNVMRICLETVMREMLPYDPLFLVELGNRLAAYTVTAGPPAMQHLMIEAIQTGLPAPVEDDSSSSEGPDAKRPRPAFARRGRPAGCRIDGGLLGPR